MKIVLILLFSILTVQAIALDLSSVEVQCERSIKCSELRSSMQQLSEHNYDIDDLKVALKAYLYSDGLESFKYSLLKSDLGVYQLKVQASFFSLIENIRIEGVDSRIENSILKLLPFSSGDYFQTADGDRSIAIIKSFLARRGHSNINVSLIRKKYKNKTVLVFSVSLDRMMDVKEVKVLTPNTELRRLIVRRFSELVDKPWDRIEFKKMQDQLEREYFDQGYFFSRFISLRPEVNGGKVILRVQVELGRRYHYSFRGSVAFTRQELSSRLKQIVKKQLGRFEERELTSAISKMYEEKGVFGTEVSLRTQEGVTKFGIPFTNIYFNIQEGKKIAITEMSFVGNDAFGYDDLIELYYQEPTVIAERGYLDNDYLRRYASLIKKMYLEQGFVFIYVSEPKIRIKNHVASIEIEIREGQRCRLVDIQITNATPRLEKGIVNHLVNKVGKYLNVLALPNDLTGAVKYVRNQGYYFATIKNLNQKNILKYSEDFSEATLVLDFNVEKKAILDSIVISGNKQTRSKVLKREVDLSRGDVITPKDIDSIWDRLTGLGLFSKIDISPFVTNKDKDDDYYNVNLLIQVDETDSRVLELSPGFRTDLGAKISGFYSDNNIGGMNRSASIKTQVNRKVNNDGIESERAKEKPGMFEGEVTLSYLEPYLLKIPLEFSPEISGGRKRYYSFDADIMTFSLGLSKDFNRYFSSSVKYQFEAINQYNATDTIDNGYFQIGGVTTSLAFDFTDQKVPAKKGAWFGLSFEYANPQLGSMSTGDLEVNFLKMISRNKFYIPYKKWVLASSFSLGMQRNLADSSDFIPSIKVFRLSGVDLVRGYDDSEINRVESGDEISEVTINDRAFFTNIKVEPRYYMSDSTIVGLFVDAGNVTVNKIDFETLRYAAGVTFKYLTPVGTIDFDYGVKLGRKKDEGLGKFHLSIGFF